MELELNAIHGRNGVEIVRCKGRIIYGPEAEAFSQACENACLQGSDLVVNLAAVTSIDNHGVGALVGLLAVAKVAGREVRVVLPSGRNQVARILKLMKVYERFDVYAREEQAAGSVRERCAVA